MNKIVLNEKHRENLDEVEVWLRANVGRGTRRFRINTWMGVDDWFYYEDVPPPRETTDEFEEDEADIQDGIEYDMVFVFRREEDSTMFAIKWA